MAGSSPEQTPLPYPAFVDDLMRIQGDGRIRSLPWFADNLSHDGRIPADVSMYRRMEGVYLTDRAIDLLGSGRQPGRELEFHLRTQRRLGRERSYRQVFFGDLTLGEGGPGLPVAVKPFKADALHHATHEAAMYQYMDQLGLPALKVLGMVAVSEGKTPRSYLLTQFMPNIQSLDNTPWQELSPDERWRRMQPAIDTAVLLHSNAFSHGDFEIKNIAIGETPDEAIINDTERSVSLRKIVAPYTLVPSEIGLLAQGMRTDFTSLDNSIKGTVVEADMSDSERFEQMLVNIYEPYAAALEEVDTPYRGAALNAYNIVIAQKRREVTS